MKNLSKEVVAILVVVLAVFGYLQGVVVPDTEARYANQSASAITSLFQKKAAVQPCIITTLNKCGIVRIIKDTVPNAYQDFLFQTNIPGYSPFVLDDDSTLVNPSTTSHMRNLMTPINGTFNVWESPMGGGYSVSVSCVDPTNNTTTLGATANIVMDAGEFITCTFTNTKTNVDPTIPPVACTAPNTWTQRANFTGGDRAWSTGFSIGNKGYLGTGQDLTSTTFSDFWEYDPAINTWTQKADFGGGVRLGATGFSIGNKGYIGLGSSNGTILFQDFWEYDPVLNTWTQKANFLGISRAEAVGFSIGTKGYIGTGNSGGVLLNDFWEYDPSVNVWNSKASLPTLGRELAVGFSIGTKGYIGTGSGLTGMSSLLSDFWEYNPATNSWTQKANFGGGLRASATGFSLNGKGYLGTGFYPGPGLIAVWAQDFWEYDPVLNIWTQKASFGGGLRNLAVGFSIGANGYVGTGLSFNGGINSIDHQDLWCYKP